MTAQNDNYIHEEPLNKRRKTEEEYFCYMNSIIQCLSNTPPLAKYFTHNSYAEDLNTSNDNMTQGQVVEEVAQMIKALWSGQYKSISPHELKVTVGQYKLQFGSYEQQDSHKFLTFLLGWMHKDLKKESKMPIEMTKVEKEWDKAMNSQKSIISDLFFGQLRYTITCSLCKKVITKYKTFNSLTMSLSYTNQCTLNDCIENFVMARKLIDSKCLNCQTPRDATQNFDLVKLPPILVIHLNHFPESGGWLERSEIAVDFPLTGFNLRPYFVSESPTAISNTIGNYDYTLYAMSNYYGTIDDRHYWTFCKNATQNKWYKYDHETVTEVSSTTVKFANNTAYLLFYTSFSDTEAYTPSVDITLKLPETPKDDPIYGMAKYPAFSLNPNVTATDLDNVANLILDTIEFPEWLITDEKDEHRRKMKNAKKDVLPQHKITLNNLSQNEVSMKPVTDRNNKPVHSGLTGLKNLGNSCYMNSIIQCLSNTTYLAEYFIDNAYADNLNTSSDNMTQGRVVKEVAQVIKALWSGQYKSISLHDLKIIVGEYKVQFASYEQQDSHEFLIFLLEWMHNDLKKEWKMPIEMIKTEKKWNEAMNSQTSIISDLFFGQWRSTITCSFCKYAIISYKTFNSLTIPLSPAKRCTLNDCIENFVTEQEVIGLMCLKCSTYRKATQKIDLVELPSIVVIHLNRLPKSGLLQRFQVDFPLTGFNLRPYLVSENPMAMSNNIRNYNYTLYAMSNFYSTMNGGHYTAFCKNATQNKWYEYNDETVKEVSSDTVKFMNTTVYVLFYTSFLNAIM